MLKNSGEFSVNDAKRLAQSDAGKELMALLQRRDTQALNSAMEQAAAGDMEAAKAAMTSLISDPQVQALLRQLGGGNNG
ncbi:MAG: hypothetical protein IJV82_03295 [Oscillospiraceae bacterium]|nr:hypothetical protein [Oscillospiraceae bacterium]